MTSGLRRPTAIPMRTRTSLVMTVALLVCFAATWVSAQQSRTSISFATYLGSNGLDSITSLATDASGAVYVSGGMPFDASTIWTPTYTSFGQAPANSPQCYFAKLIPSGSGGLAYEYIAVIRDGFGCGPMAVAPNGDVALAGPVSVANSVVRLFSHRQPDGLVQTATLTVPLQTVDHLRLDNAGRTYAAGLCGQEQTAGTMWPLPNGAQPHPAPGLCTNPAAIGGTESQEALVVADSSGLITHGTFLGTSASELDVTALDVDGNNRVLLAGHTIDGLAAVTPDAYQPQPAGASDAFLAIVDPGLSGSSSLVYASYFGGAGVERDVSIALTPAGTVYLAGNTETRAGFPGRDFAEAAIFLSLLDLSRPSADQLRSTTAVVESPLTSLYGNVETTTGMRLLPNGSIAFLADSADSQFPLVQPIYSGPYDPASANPRRPLLLVYDPAASAFTLATFLDDVQQARSPLVAPGAAGELYLGMTTVEAGRATDASTPLGLADVLLFAISQRPSNRPPTVSIFENLTTVYADSPTAGALLQLNAIASDPEGDTLTYSWTGPFTDSPDTTNNYLVGRVPLGTQQTVTVTVDDGHGNVVSASRTFDVVGTPFVGMTATPIDSNRHGLVFNYAPVTITATAIGVPGRAYLRSRLDQALGIPDTWQAGSPPLYFDLSTDATLTAPIEVCVDTRGMSLANPDGIRLHQYQLSAEGGAWTDVTSIVFLQDGRACGETQTLGTFAIFYPQVPSTAVQTIAGNGVLAGSNDGPGGNPIDDVVDGPARQTALPYLLGGAYDRARNRLFVSAGGYILRLSLSDDTITRVAGNGVGVVGSIDGPGGDPGDDLIDGGDALTTYVGFPIELATSPTGDVVFIDRNTCLVRRLDIAQGRLYAVAGNGTCGFSGEGGPATLAAIWPGAMAFDAAGHLFIADPDAASIRRIDAVTGVIDTVAGDGSFATPTDGAPARSAIGLPAGLAFDAQGHLIVAAGMHLIRISTGAADALVDGDADETISILGGCNTNCQVPFNGDGLPIGHPQLYLPGLGHVAVAQDGAVLFRDYFRIRRIAPGADGIVTGAADEIVRTVGGYYDWETLGLISNFNGDTFSTQSRFSPVPFVVDDPQGRIIVVDGNNFRVRRFGLPPSAVTPPMVEIDVTEAVVVGDSVGVLPSSMIELVESVAVQDGPSVQPVPFETRSITPANGAPPTAAIVPISTGPGEQLDPHVSKDLIAYTDNGLANPGIRYFDFSTGLQALVPTAPFSQDTLSDVNDGRITFSRQNPTGERAVLMFVPATGVTHTVSPFGAGEFFATAIGYNTVAFVDAATGNGEIAVHNLVSGLTQVLDPSTQFDTGPNVSPDGNTVVWQRCPQNFSSCDILKAVAGSSAWTVSPVSATAYHESNPDTDGTWIVYGGERASSAGGSDIYFQPVAGGVESRLDLPGRQGGPTISRGVIAFQSRGPSDAFNDLYVYAIATNLLYRVTSTPNVNESLSDISVLDNGDVRVVWAANDGPFGENKIYATTFPLIRATDTTPPVAVLDVARHLLSGQTLPLSGARSTDVGGTIATYRWAIPDAGIEVETTTPTYEVPATDLAALPVGSHSITLVVVDSSGNASAVATQVVEVIAQQVVSPADAGLVSAPIQAISAGSGDQNDPHVHKDLMAYTENAGITSTVRTFDFSAGAGAPIPQSSGEVDLLADVNQNRVVFSRVASDRTTVFVFDAASGTVTEVDPRAGVNRLGTAMGGNTVVYVDLLSGSQDVVSYDLSTGTSSVLGGPPYPDFNPGVSPDGNVLVWQRDDSSSDIYQAVRAQGTWNVSAAVATSAQEVNPDTDGTWVVYDRIGVNGNTSAVFFRAFAGGPEFAIAGFVQQQYPAVSAGVIAFAGRRAATDPIDLFVYDITSNRLFQVTSNADVEALSDISVLDNGEVRVVWAAAPDYFAPHRVYATTFSMLPLPTVTVAPASGAAGESIALSATLTSEGAPVADALLEFHVDGDPAVAFQRTGPNGVATVNWTIGVNPGTYPDGIRVNFPGDPARRLGPASGAATLVVNRASTALALTTAPEPVVVTTPVTATAVVSSPFGIPGGDVSFTERDGTAVTPLGTVPLDAGGAASLVLSNLPAGGHVICAEYAGSAIHSESLACTRVTVAKASTQTTLSSSRNPSLSTGPPVFIATIQATAGVRPTGKVEFFAGGTLLCRSTVHTIGGVRTQASCGGAPLTIGSHAITATYTGDANFDASRAAALAQTVQPGGYLTLDLGFEGEAVALSPNGWVTGNSVVRAALSAANIVTGYVHNGTTVGVAQPIPSLGGTKTVAVGVDDAGRVAGSATTATGETHVFLFDGATTHDRHNPAFGGANSRAMAMNSSGAIVGIADTATAFRAFADLRGGAFDLGTIAGGTHSAAFAISEPVFGTSGLGHIAGISTIAGGAGRAALFGGATVIDLGTLGGPASGASAVNRAGEAAGFSDLAGGARHAFIHRDGAMLDIGASLGSLSSLATAINDAGQVVGTYEDVTSGTPVSRVFLHSLDSTTDLGLGTSVTLNNAGVVVQNGTNAIAIRTGGGIVVLAPASGGNASHQLGAMVATAINDEGRIAGYIAGPNNRARATVWIPVPFSSLTVDAAAAPAGATVSLSATLTSQGVAVANKPIRFTLEGADAGTALTDASGRATLTATLPALAEGTYPEGIRALFSGDETLGAAVATAVLTVEAASADLSLTATASPTTVDAGGTVRYTVTVTNGGPSPASGVSINVSAPASLILGSTYSPGGPCVGSILGGSLDCFVLAPIPAGGQYVMTVDARPTAAGTVSATFTVAASSSDPAPANNQVSVALTVNPAADLAIAAVPSRTLYAVGEPLTYAVSVTNNGPAAAPSASVALTPDAGFTIDQVTLPGLVCTTTLFSRTWTCGLGDIAPGATVPFSVIGRATATNPGTNTFAVGSALPDPAPANNVVAVAYDARPTVTINQAPGQADPTTVGPIAFRVTFSEPVTGFAPADVSFAGSTVGGTLVATVTGSGAAYTVSVTGMTGAGLVVVSIPAGVAVDSGGNPSAASTSTDRTVLYGVSTAVAVVSPGNGGTASVTVFSSVGQITGLLFYARGSVTFFATRFTSFIIDGQTATLEGFSSSSRFFVATMRDGGAGQPDTFRLWIEGVEQTAGGAIASGFVVVQPWGPDTRLRGWVDLHTHPMSNVAFGGKLFHGAPSVGSLMPAVQMAGDPGCRFDARATGIAEALSQDAPTRGDPLQSRCGDAVRNTLIKALESFNGASTAPAGADGFPAFTYWPAWHDITHQKMWIDWIRRAWEGGQRVMVALSQNNRTIAELLGAGGPISGVRNDRASSDLQIEEIKRLVADHPDFMAVATTPAELHAIVRSGRLAVVLGVEIDNIGDFSAASPPTEQAIEAEIARLHAQGVRYVLPIHFTDNAFGDAAVHESLFNVLNFRENQRFFTVGCAQLSDQVSFQSAGIPPVLGPFLLPGMPLPVAPSCLVSLGSSTVFLGHVNTRLASGLTAGGEFAIRAMMRRGIIVDLDHMSNRAANRALAIASAVPGGGYPLMSGHSGVRDRATPPHNAENSRTPAQLARIACLGGMFGLGTDTAGAYRWAAQYEVGYNAMRRAFAPNGLCPASTPLGGGFIGLGTDANSLVKTPTPPLFDPVGPPRITDIYNPGNPLNSGVPPLFRSTTGTRTWDYNVDGVAHYGMFVDFLRDVRTWNPNGATPGRQIVDDQMMYGAEYFYRMWLKADTQKSAVP